LIAGAWNQVGEKWNSIDDTIKKLKSYGVKNIYLIGPVPIWYNNLPQQLLLATTTSLNHIVPLRLRQGLIEDFFQIDRDMKKYAKQNKVNYISIVEILCNDNGCLTRLGENANDLTTFDYGHFTKKASEFVVQYFNIK
jgi:hypothetical protein